MAKYEMRWEGDNFFVETFKADAVKLFKFEIG